MEEAATTSGDLEFVRPNCKAEAEAGTCKTDPMYMESIDCNIICDGKITLLIYIFHLQT